MGRRHEQTLLPTRHTNGQQTRENMLHLTCHQGNTNQNRIETPPAPVRMAKKEGTYCMVRWVLYARNKSWNFTSKTWDVLCGDKHNVIKNDYKKQTNDISQRLLYNKAEYIGEKIKEKNG